jgi:Uma2 family endonuclease
MSILVPPLPTQQAAPTHPAGPVLHRLSVDDYHRMIETGILCGQPIELLEGLLARKIPIHPPHSTALQRTWKRILPLLPGGWELRVQQPVTLADSEPEPDVCVARGSDADYTTHHPGPADVGLAVEVSESSLATDQNDKARIYARAGLVTYWIVNLVDRQVEVRTAPSGPAATNPAYGQLQTYAPGTSVPLTLDGVALGQIAVDDLLP